jgi:hypothetical protein
MAEESQFRLIAVVALRPKLNSMQRSRTTASARSQGLRPVMGGCLLLLYVLAATPVATMAVALLAELDRSHHAAVRPSAQGLQVVLQHGCHNAAPHRHGLVARTLTFFARPTATPDADHVIQFGSASDSISCCDFCV